MSPDFSLNDTWIKAPNTYPKTTMIMNSEVTKSIKDTPNVLHGCGEICAWDTPGVQSLFFLFIQKDFDCMSLWLNPEIDMRRTGPPTSLEITGTPFLAKL